MSAIWIIVLLDRQWEFDNCDKDKLNDIIIMEQEGKPREMRTDDSMKMCIILCLRSLWTGTCIYTAEKMDIKKI